MDIWPAKSINFEFLRPRWGDLAALGGFAEQYAHPDIATSSTTIRNGADKILDRVEKMRKTLERQVGILNAQVEQLKSIFGRPQTE